MCPRIETGNKILNQPIFYDTESRLFEVTVEVEGAKRKFSHPSEDGLKAKIDKMVKNPPIKSIHVRYSSWSIERPYLRDVLIRGGRVYEAPTADRKRPLRVSADEYFNYSDEGWNQLTELYEEHEKLKTRWREALNKLGLIKK